MKQRKTQLPDSKVKTSAGYQAHEKLRFAFGKNWKRFPRGFDDGHIRRAEEFLQDTLDRVSFDRGTILDIGSGSGLSNWSGS